MTHRRFCLTQRAQLTNGSRCTLHLSWRGQSYFIQGKGKGQLHTFCWRHSLQARFTAMLRRPEGGREPSASPFWKSSSSLDAERLKPRCWVCGLLAKPRGRPVPVPGVVGESWSDMDMMLSFTLIAPAGCCAAGPISLTEVVPTCNWESFGLRGRRNLQVTVTLAAASSAHVS